MPKAEEPAELALAARVLAEAGSRARLAALVESARGVARAAQLAEATPRLEVLIFGAFFAPKHVVIPADVTAPLRHQGTCVLIGAQG